MAWFASVFFFCLFALSSAATVGECDASALGYECMKTLSDNFNVHWTLRGEVLHMALEGKGAEWVAISFPEKAEKMWPADAVIGWIDINGPNVLPYRLVDYSVFAQDEDIFVQLTDVDAKEDAEGTIIQFTRSIAQGQVKIDPREDTDVNWAVGDADRLAVHFAMGSDTLRLAAEPGEGRTTAFRPPALTQKEEEKDSAETSVVDLLPLTTEETIASLPTQSPDDDEDVEAPSSEPERDDAIGEMLDELV